MGFSISGLSPAPFNHLFGLPDEALREQSVLRYHADETTSFTDRIEMRDARPGETVLLLNHVCQPASTPYRATHAIFVLEHADTPYASENEVPECMQLYPQSLRGFDNEGMLIEADLATGNAVAPTIERLFTNPRIAYIHAHNAKQGCYAGRVDRL